MNIAYIDKFTKFVFSRNPDISTSSEFTEVTSSIYKRCYPGMYDRLQPILDIELANDRTDWAANCVFSEYYLAKLTAELIYDAMIAYRIVLDFFLNNDLVSKQFIMDETDTVGWKIYKELDTKYNFCRKRLAKLEYTKETNV